MKRALIAASACLLLGSAALAAELPRASPSEVGMGRLERLTQFFKADTDAKRLPGAVVKLDRVAQPGPDPDTHETATLTDVTKTRTFLGGGEGLLSTAPDYMRFALMLANGGELNGTRLLSRKTVELMASDHLGPALSQGPNFAPGPGYGFGLTVAVRTQPGMASYPGSVGEFSGSGAAGTAFWVDPKEQLVPIMLIQAPGQRLHYRFAFHGLVYQAISDRPEPRQ